MSLRVRWIVLASLVAVNLVMVAIGAFGLTHLTLVVLAGQTSLLGLWAAWGTEAWVVRWPRVCLLAVLQVEAFCLGLRAQAPFSDLLFFALLVQSAAIILGTQAILAGIRWLWPVRVELIKGVESVSANNLPRLTIRRLLVWTAIIGALLTACRMMDSPELSQMRSPDASLNPLLSVGGFLHTLWSSAVYAIPTIAAALPWASAMLVRRHVWIWQAGALLYLGLITLVEFAIPWRFFSSIWTSSGIVESNLAIVTVVVTNLLVVRACGYRLVRAERP